MRPIFQISQSRKIAARENYKRRLREMQAASPPTPPGPRCLAGTALTALLEKFGIRADEKGCKCKSRAAQMDAAGCEWCQQNLDTIVGWLREEAEKRRLPFLDAAGRLLVRRAIRNAKRAAAS